MNKSTSGFTLIEIMIALAIVGVLAAIAVPTYQQYRIRENRNEMKSTMMQIAQRLTEYKLVNNNFNTTLTKVYGSAVYPTSGTRKYNLSIVTTANSWTLFAFPAGQQVGNGSLVLTDQGWNCWVQAQDSACVPTATTKWDGN